MKRLALFAVCAMVAALAQAAEAPSPGKMIDRQITMIDKEVVPLAEAMPADKYDFAPTSGEFKGVRTFGQQMAHIAATIEEVAAALTGEKLASDPEQAEKTLKTKDEIVKYLKSSLVKAHAAMAGLTAANMDEQVSWYGGGDKMPRLSMASVIVWHTFDHYGQSVVYARMNGVIPPASRQQ